MPNITINIKYQIDNLFKRHEELNDLWVDPQGPSNDDKTHQRTKINFYLTQITLKISLLSLTMAHRNAASIVVNRPTQTEIDTIQTALNRLSEVVGSEETFNETVLNVTAILEAADTINQAVQ